MPSPNRIFFPGNPWPEGHALVRLLWTGRIEADGLYFDLDLESADYDAADDEDEDEDEDEEDEDEDAEDAWTSVGVWTNYQSCCLSSTKWEHTRGFRVATADVQLDWRKLPDRLFEVDMEKAVDDEEGRAFHLYLLGHDTALRHRIQFREPKGAKHRLRWAARVALTYVGSADLVHELKVDADVTFEGFRAAKGLENPRAFLERFTCGKTRYTEREGVYLPE